MAVREMTFITILLLAALTFTTRYLFLEGRLPVRLGPNIKQLLSYSAPAVLSAICLPIIFIHDQQFNWATSNPYLWGGVAATIAAYKTSNVYWTVGFGVCGFVLSGSYF
jgi:branched-subunit amino acid transport protein